MEDLVIKLRSAADRADQIFDTTFASPWREAADEIERLRKALQDVKTDLEICYMDMSASRFPGPPTAIIARIKSALSQ